MNMIAIDVIKGTFFSRVHAVSKQPNAQQRDRNAKLMFGSGVHGI